MISKKNLFYVAVAAIAMLDILAMMEAHAAKRFVVPGGHAVSLVEEYREGVGVSPDNGRSGPLGPNRGVRAGSNALLCPGRSPNSRPVFCSFVFFAAMSGYTTMEHSGHAHRIGRCIRVAPGWKVVDVRINGTPKRWVRRGWSEGDPRCLRTVIELTNNNTNRRDFSVDRVILEGPNSARTFREAFDY